MGGSMEGLGSQALNYLGSLVDQHTDPNSLIRRGTDSLVSNVIGAPVAAMQHAENIPAGLVQAGAHIANAATGGALQNATNGMDRFINNRDATYQAGTPTNAGSVAGATVGELAPWLSGIVALRAGGLIPTATTTAGKLGTLALEGGAMGASQPVNNASQPQGSSYGA
jgi:hypothetical protein